MKLILYLLVAHLAICAAAFCLYTRWREASQTSITVPEPSPVTLPPGLKLGVTPFEEVTIYERIVPLPLTLYGIGGILALLLALGFTFGSGITHESLHTA